MLLTLFSKYFSLMCYFLKSIIIVFKGSVSNAKSATSFSFFDLEPGDFLDPPFLLV